MADITEAEQWDTGVYQLETTDPVQGGVDGVDNIPHKALANRTVWLKAQVALKALLGGSATQLFKAKAGVASDDVVNKGQLDTKTDLSTANSYDLGVGQTWVDETANRSPSTTYTNTTGKPIMVSVSLGTSDNNSRFVVDGVQLTRMCGTSSYYWSATVVVPNGSTYSFDTTGGLVIWAELK